MKICLFYLVSVLALITSCLGDNNLNKSLGTADSSRTTDSLTFLKDPEKIDTVRGNFDDCKYTDTSKVILFYHNLYVDSLIKYKETGLPFDEIKGFKIVSVRIYSFKYKWKAFLIEGMFLPTNVTYYFLGALKDKVIIQPELFTQPVEINLTFEKYEYTEHALAVYGEKWTDVCSNNNKEEHKEPSLILSAFDN